MSDKSDDTALTFRYYLAVEESAWGDSITQSNNLEALKDTARRAAGEGLRCFIVDRQTGRQINFSRIRLEKVAPKPKGKKR